MATGGQRFGVVTRLPWFAAAVFAAVPAAAQVGLAVSPSVVEHTAPAGGRVTDVITFNNRSAHMVEVSISLADFEVSEANDLVERPSGTLDGSLARYLRISPLRATVGPGQRASFRYSASLPEEFDHLRTMVFFSARPPAAEQAERQVQVVPRLGVPVYVENPRAPAAKLQVEELQWRRFGDEGARIVLELVLVNEGRRIIRPDGFLRVRDGAGFDESFEFNPGKGGVLPGMRRRWSLEFGPVPGGELSMHLRFATSPRESHESRHQLSAWQP